MARNKTSAKDSTPPDPPSDVKYGEAVEEIERILESIDRDEIDVDDLSAKVERAVELIRLCQLKLRSTEMRVTEVLKDLEVPEGGEQSSAQEEVPDRSADQGEEDQPE